MATTDSKISTRPSSAPAPKSAAAPKPAVASKPVAVAPEPEPEPVPVVERISIGSLVVEKTVYDDGEEELVEIKTIRADADEKFKSWRHAQPF